MKNTVYRTMAAQIADRLRQEILSLELPEGTPLIEEDISLRFGVSRGPVRDALRELVKCGLLSLRGKTGYQVAAHPADDVLALVVHIRGEIESFVFKSVIKTLSEADLGALRENLEGMRDGAVAGDAAAYRECDIHFHEFLIRKFKDRQVEDLWRSLVTRMVFRYNLHGDLPASYEKHKAIYEAIAAKNTSRAIKNLLSHLY